MFFPTDEKPTRMAALKTLMNMMEDEKSKKLGALKKPIAASMTIEKVPPDSMKEDMEGIDDDMDNQEEDDEEPSDSDKAKISELYHKYC